MNINIRANALGLLILLLPLSSLVSAKRCGCSSCDDSILNRDADGHSVVSRIDWVKANMGQSEEGACNLVCNEEFPNICSQCAPAKCNNEPKRCGCSFCDDSVLNRNAGGHSVVSRIDWVKANMGQSEEGACNLVCNDEYPTVCSECAPKKCNAAPSPSPRPPSPTPPIGTRCGCSSCNDSILNRDASGHSVVSRIDWVKANMGQSEEGACNLICNQEFPNICSECAPAKCNGGGPPSPSPRPPSPTPPAPTTPGSRPGAPFNESVNSGFRNRGMLPYLFDNNSEFSDNEIYVAMTGKRMFGNQEKWVYLDLSTMRVEVMNENKNTIRGPSGDTTGFRYADIFTRLTDFNSKTIGIPQMFSGKMFISFKKPLYIHFHDNAEEAGFTQPDFNNPSDPNKNIRFETIELTWNDRGLWINTSRVDAYQYPMGLEAYGGAIGPSSERYKKVGELLSHSRILELWPQRVSSTFSRCLVPLGQDFIIKQPSKIREFKEGGPHVNYFAGYINSIWNTYRSRTLKADFGDIGVWQGRVSGNTLTMRCVENCSPIARPGSIRGIPTTQEVIEAKGKLATPGEWDGNVQKMIAAAIHRHAINVNLPSGTTQRLGNRDMFYRGNPHNEYSAFFHGFDITHNSETYAFSYDDVMDQSSTVHARGPEKIRITVGGFHKIQ